MSPIPLTSPDGIVYAYACGVCHHVCSGGERFTVYTGDDVTESAEWSRNAAERCCRCLACRGVNPRGSSDVLHCAACKPEEDAKFAKWIAERAEKHDRLEDENERRLCHAASATHARLLLDEMRDLSEDYFCASWLIGLEFRLWDAINGAETELHESDLASLKYHRELAGGWWIWSDDHGGEIFVTTKQWEEILKNRTAVSP